MFSHHYTTVFNKIKKIFKIRNESYLFIKNFISNNGYDPILALTGKDWKSLSRYKLYRFNKKFKAILALDDVAVFMAYECKIPFMTIEKFMEPFKISEICYKAHHLSKTWFKDLAQLYIKEGVNWAQIDQESLRFFWNEALIAAEFMKIIQKIEQKLVVVTRTPYTPAAYYYAEDTFGRICLSSQSPLVFEIKSSGLYQQPKFIPMPSWTNLGLENIKDAYICVINPAEINRSRDILMDLENKYANNFIVLTIGPYNGAKFSFPIISLPISLYNCNNDQIFSTAWHEIQEYDLDIPKFIYPYVYQTMHYYHSRRWPSLIKIFLQFQKLFSLHRPRCVMGTDLVDAESQLAAVAANSLGIPTFAWGHALVNNFDRWQPYCSKKILVPTRYAYEAAKLAKIPENRIVNVRNINRDTLYDQHVISWPIRTKSDEIRILILPYINRISGTSYICSNLQTHTTIVNFLCNPPPKIKDKIIIRFKCHPQVHTYSPFILNGINGSEYLFPSNASLQPLLDECDICILLGEIGCALVHSSKRVPTIFIPDDAKLFHLYSQQAIEYIYPLIIRNYKETWNYIEKIINDPYFTENMMKKQLEFVTSVDNSVFWLDTFDMFDSKHPYN